MSSIAFGCAVVLAMTSEPAGAVQQPSSAAPAGRHEAALGVGYVSVDLSYARRLAGGPVSVGVGLWGAWEPRHTFERNVWEPIGIVGFGRYALLPFMRLEAGAGVMRYLWADDCSECTGRFTGVRVGPRLESGFVWIAPVAWIGQATDDWNRTGVGMIFDVSLGVRWDWGR